MRNTPMPIPSLYSSASRFAGSAAVGDAAADPTHHKDGLTSPQDSELQQKEKLRGEQEKLQELRGQVNEAGDKGFFGDIGKFFGVDDAGAADNDPQGKAGNSTAPAPRLLPAVQAPPV